VVAESRFELRWFDPRAHSLGVAACCTGQTNKIIASCDKGYKERNWSGLKYRVKISQLLLSASWITGMAFVS
jgi:hypothetical protein